MHPDQRFYARLFSGLTAILVGMTLWGCHREVHGAELRADPCKQQAKEWRQ